MYDIIDVIEMDQAFPSVFACYMHKDRTKPLERGYFVDAL